MEMSRLCFVGLLDCAIGVLGLMVVYFLSTTVNVYPAAYSTLMNVYTKTCLVHISFTRVDSVLRRRNFYNNGEGRFEESQ